LRNIRNLTYRDYFLIKSGSDTWIPEAVIEHIARIKDVEILSGISVFSAWTGSSSTSEVKAATIRKKLWLPQMNGEWLNDFINNPPESPTTSEISTTSTGVTILPNRLPIYLLVVSTLSYLLLN